MGAVIFDPFLRTAHIGDAISPQEGGEGVILGPLWTPPHLPSLHRLHEPEASVTQLPLWNTAVYTAIRETGATYQCPALIRKGVLKIGDLHWPWHTVRSLHYTPIHEGVRQHGVRMPGEEQPTRKRQSDWARDRGDQELGSQDQAPLMAVSGGAPVAAPGQPHAGGGVQRLMFVTYVNIEDQRRDEGHRCAVYLAHRTEALALRTAEEEDRWQLLARLHYVRRQGLQWERYPGCRGMLEGWRAERLRRKLQAQEQQARHTLEREACLRQETYGRYNLARQWCRNQRQLQGIAQGLAQMAGLVSLECEWRDRLAQEESQHMVAQGGSFVQTAEAAGRRGLQDAAMRGLGLLHA